MRESSRHILAWSIIASFGVVSVQQGMLGVMGTEVFASTFIVQRGIPNVISLSTIDTVSFHSPSDTGSTTSKIPTASKGFHPIQVIKQIVGNVFHAVSSIAKSLTPGVHALVQDAGKIIGGIAPAVVTALHPVTYVLAKLAILQIPSEVLGLSTKVANQITHDNFTSTTNTLPIAGQVLGDIGQGLGIFLTPVARISLVGLAAVVGGVVGAITGGASGLIQNSGYFVSDFTNFYHEVSNLFFPPSPKKNPSATTGSSGAGSSSGTGKTSSSTQTATSNSSKTNPAISSTNSAQSKNNNTEILGNP